MTDAHEYIIEITRVSFTVWTRSKSTDSEFNTVVCMFKCFWHYD